MARPKRTRQLDYRLEDTKLPIVENEPTLEEWLANVDAELLWQHDAKERSEGVPSYRVTAYRIGIRTAIVVIRSHGLGWDVFTSSGSDDPDRVLSDAESRLSR
jgi:hypothetical protein